MRSVMLVLALAALACSSSPPAGGASLRMDVIPVFVASCAFNGCHNDPTVSLTTSAEGGAPLEFLAEKDDAGSSMFAQQAYDGIVGKPSIEDPSMPFVTPGDPSKSFLMRKMDDDLVGLSCAPNNALQAQYQTVTACGGSMPSQLPILDSTRRDIVRSWIQQGAKNN